MKNEIITKLRALITKGCIGIKLSTEDAGNSFPQILYWTEEIGEIIPVIVKIGGPEARNDMKELSEMNIKGIIAPMVESDYGLKTFINALRDILSDDAYRRLSKRVNIETQTAFNNFGKILSTPESRDLEVVTIGRTDLSKSMGTHVDDPRVTSMAKKITLTAQKKGLKVSVGGNINNQNAERIRKEIRPNFINTRSVAFDLAKCKDIKNAVLEGLDFEELMMRIDLERGFVLKEEAEKRINQLRQRRLNLVA